MTGLEELIAEVKRLRASETRLREGLRELAERMDKESIQLKGMIDEYSSSGLNCTWIGRKRELDRVAGEIRALLSLEGDKTAEKG